MKVTATVPLHITAALAGPWTPQRNAAGNITNYADIPARTWTEVPGTKMEDTIKPILDAGGYDLYKYGSNKLSAVMDNYSGAAFDPVRGRMHFTGGGHHGGSDNGVYGIDLNKMRWSITAYPTHPTKDLLPGQARFYGEGSARGTNGTGNDGTQVLALVNSSTGFAIKYWVFSSLAWWEVVGPERWIMPEDVVFPDGGKLNQMGTQPAHYPYPAYTVAGDVMFDGRPLSRHTYGGFLYSSAADCLVSVVRAYWKCKLDGSGWVKAQEGGAKRPEKTTGEGVWAHVDEKTGKVWWGGCGSGCHSYGYYYYSQGMVFDPATMTETGTGMLRPDHFYAPGGVMMVNCGDLMVLPFKADRKIGGWCSTGWGWTFDLDTSARQLIWMDGEKYPGFDGCSSCYIPHLGQLWGFDTSKPSMPLWVMDIGKPQPGGPEGALKIPTRRETIAKADALPSSGNGLVYTRLQFWEKHKLIVYFPGTQQNAWVCRVP